MEPKNARDESGLNSPAPPGQKPEMIVVFRVGELRLGIDVRQVREIVRAVSPSAPLPDTRGVAGVITLRGESTAVVDLNMVMGITSDRRGRHARMIAAHHGGATVCLLVDQVDGLQDVTNAHLERPPPVIADRDTQWFDYITRCADGELVGVVNVDRLLSSMVVAGTEVSTPGV